MRKPRRLLAVLTLVVLTLLGADTLGAEAAEAAPKRRAGATAQRRSASASASRPKARPARRARRARRARQGRRARRPRRGRRAPRAPMAALPPSNKRVDIVVPQQQAYLYENGVLVRTLRVSTGTERRWCARGRCGSGHTPRGHFRIFREEGPGYRSSLELGPMPWAHFFTGGIAIHGGDVSRPFASHGCVRIERGAAAWFAHWAPRGTAVNVY